MNNIIALLDEIKNYENELINLRRSLHEIPEIGDELPKTKQLVCNYLKDICVPYKTIDGCDGVIAEIKGKKGGKTLAFRADMDGLHINEENDVLYKSKIDGQMHGCGHDAHTAILLLTAKILSMHKESFYGTIRFIFQSGEETGSGAKKMIANGAIDGVDAIFAIHVGNLAGDDNKSGDIIIKSGPVSAGKNKFTITVKGKGTHSAFPEKGIDPIIISAKIITACEDLIKKEIPTGTNAVLTFGSIVSGQDHNTIPDKAILKGSIRCQDEKIREFLGERLVEISKTISKSYKGDVDIDLKRGSMTVMNDNELSSFAYNSLKVVYNESVYNQSKSALMGSDDFANYANKIPAVYFFLHTNNKDICYANHNPKFNVDEKVLIKGVVSYALIALDYLNE